MKRRLLQKNIRFGDLRRLDPFSRIWGYDRGQPIDRYYIESFLTRHACDVKGRVLEVADNYYTRMLGGRRVSKSDILHVTEGNRRATIVGDLTRARHIPSNTFDCIILTQTLYLIYDLKAAVRTLWRILKPKGILLATFPGINKVSRYDMARWGEHWRFTSLSARRLFEVFFLPEKVEIEAHGNVLVAAAFLYGLAAEELKRKELDYFDPDYEVLLTVRAIKNKEISKSK